MRPDSLSPRARNCRGKELRNRNNNMLKLGRYEHYKGNHYEVNVVARHSETMEDLVVYRALYGERVLWVRPLKMFLEEVEIGDKKVPRFRYIGE